GNLVMIGETAGIDFPVVGGLQRNPTGFQQAFVTKFNPQDASIIYSTYLPASGNSNATGLAIDTQRDVYISGAAGSSDFPFTSDLSVCTGTCEGGGFAVKLGNDGSIVYATLIGQVGPGAIAVDSTGNAYVTGTATFDGSIQTVNAYQPNYLGLVCTSC